MQIFEFSILAVQMRGIYAQFYFIQKVHMHLKINCCQIWVINRSKYDHFIILLICPTISRMTCVLGWREQVDCSTKHKKPYAGIIYRGRTLQTYDLCLLTLALEVFGLLSFSKDGYQLWFFPSSPVRHTSRQSRRGRFKNKIWTPFLIYSLFNCVLGYLISPITTNQGPIMWARKSIGSFQQKL